LGSEILSPSIIDSINILDFYFQFKSNENRTLPPYMLAVCDPAPTFGKFYIGKSTEVYGTFLINLDQNFIEEESKQLGRMIDQENPIYFNKNK
jgi:hypothetical protein